MIRLPVSGDPELDFGLRTLVDLARLLPVASSVPESCDRGIVRFELRSDSGKGNTPFFVSEAGTVHLSVAAVRDAARKMGAVEEQVAKVRDRHGRVPSEENPFVREGTESVPIIMDLARSLREAARQAAGRQPLWCLAPWPEGARWAVALTHDLDVVSGWPALTLLRAAELVRRRHPGLALRALAAAARSVRGAPVHRAARHILEVEARHGAKGTWFILCGDPSLRSILARDLTYSERARPVRRLLAELAERGVELGLHGSFETAANPRLHAEQRSRLEEVSNRPVRGVRQHFLKMHLPQTFRGMESAGFDYDSTLGFPDRAGFRLGVADVVPLWDHEQKRRSALDELPFAWMDRSGSKYEGIEIARQWIEAAEANAARVREREGLWIGIWHPYLTDSLGYPKAPEAFETLLQMLAGERPWFASLSEIVDWRRRRRAIRAVPGESDPPQLVGPVGGRVALETASGETRQAQVDASVENDPIGRPDGAGS